MFQNLDPELVSSYAFLLIVAGFVVGIILEYTRIYPNASDYGVVFAGIVLILYAIGATIYFVITPPPEE
jgi:hypothetical protein